MGRVLVIGIDGGTFDLIRPWCAAGKLPHLARLMAEGASGLLESTVPPVTSPAWPSFATGKNPGKHGVFDFIQPSGGTYDMVNATSLRARTLWQILSEAGHQVGVMNVPVTYPPAKVNGFLISGMPAPMNGAFTYPSNLLARYAGQLKPYRLEPSVQFKQGNESAFAQDLLDVIERQTDYALRLLTDFPYPFLMFHFQATDVMQHALWRFVDPAHPRYDAEAAQRYGSALEQAYTLIDQFIGTALERVTDDTDVLVMSDHGFGALHYVVNLNLLFLEKGLLRLKRGAWTQLKGRLFRSGLTPASVWHMIERVGLQNYIWHVSRSTRNRVVGKFLSFDDVDWQRTRAYAIGHVGQIYVNLRGRQPQGAVEPGTEYEAVCREITAALAEVKHPDSSEPLVDRLIWRDDVVWGPYADRSPDCYVVMDRYHSIAFPLFAADSRVVTTQIRGDSGCHQPHGIFIAWGPHIPSGGATRGARIHDVAPTILHLLGLPVPDDMDGRVLTEVLSNTGPLTHEHATGAGVAHATSFSAEEAAQVEDRLRALGYLS
ncbi:MAG: sulfatase-like hydrolase/transferase [Anaerolineales bacterium]|nr:sulfatase-like hydrolase/transferase [Anaerolineales bacterium]